MVSRFFMAASLSSSSWKRSRPLSTPCLLVLGAGTWTFDAIVIGMGTWALGGWQCDACCTVRVTTYCNNAFASAAKDGANGITESWTGVTEAWGKEFGIVDAIRDGGIRGVYYTPRPSSFARGGTLCWMSSASCCCKILFATLWARNSSTKTCTVSSSLVTLATVVPITGCWAFSSCSYRFLAIPPSLALLFCLPPILWEFRGPILTS